MTRRSLAILSVVLVLMAAGTAAAQKAKCTDPSTQVTIVPITGSAVSDDGKASYVDGVDGVYNTAIHLCGVGASYDATVGLITSRRSMGFTFPPSIDGSPNAPAWANGTKFMTKPFLNVRNILWGRRNSQPTFTTRMSIGYIKGPGDSSDYFLKFLAPYASAFDGNVPTSDVNTPDDTVTVTVTDNLGTCANGVPASWTVTIDSPFVGTLYKGASGRTPDLHAGQYSMPFQLIITAKTCLPW